MKTKQTKAQKIVALERKLQEALASQSHVYHFASQGLNKASAAHLMGSGVVITMTVLGGRELFSPVLITDGLSDELIASLRADFLRSYELANVFKPSIIKSKELT